MDNQVISLLNQVIGEIKDIKNEMQVMKNDMQTMKNDIQDLRKEVQTMKNEMHVMKNEMQEMKNEMQTMKNDIQRNYILLEDTKVKLQILAEVQQAHKEQNERQHLELKKELNDRMTIIETSIKTLSNDVNEIKERFSAVSEVLGRHEVDIMVLRKRVV
ncbi:hypothetical protein ACAG39_10380 [Caldicellulosiruptoraceae bacterium PP1]